MGNELLAKILVKLFYPWVDACMRAAYNEYVQQRSGNQYMSSSMSVGNFLKYHAEDYLNIAFKKHWFQIIFAPWSVICSQELYEYQPTLS